jgi:hypothetical protein
MVGAISLAFTKFRLGDTNIFAGEWVGFDNFIRLFTSHYFWRLMHNTLMINVYYLVFGFTAPIILALLLNEVKHRAYKKIVHSISFLPNFIYSEEGTLLLNFGIEGVHYEMVNGEPQYTGYFFDGNDDGLKQLQLLFADGRPEYMARVTDIRYENAFASITADDEWYIVHLCSRPLPTKGRSVLGRETAIQKVCWTDDGFSSGWVGTPG